VVSGELLDNSGKAIGWLNRSKLSSIEAEHDCGVHVLGSLSIGPVVASRTIVALLKIQRRMDPILVFTVSGRLDVENVGELCQLIDAKPAGAVVVLDLTDLVLADRDAVRYLRDYETGGRIVLRNCPAYIRAWMAAEEDH